MDAKSPKSKTPAKGKGGRPSKYKKRYCALLIDHMEQGLSYESFAATIAVNRDSLYEWEKHHPEFSDAKKRGTDLGQLFWEKLGMAGMMGKVYGFSGGMWMFNMKVRYRWNEYDKAPEKGENDDIKRALDAALEQLDAPKKAG